VAADPCLRPSSHWDWPHTHIYIYICIYSLNQNEKYLMKVPHHYMQTTFMFRSETRSLRKHEEEGKLPMPVP